MKGFVLGLAEDGRKLWQRLSVAQRVSLVGITATAALGLTLMAVAARVSGDLGTEGRDLSADSSTDAKHAEDSAAEARKEGDWIFEGDGLFGHPLHRDRIDASMRIRVQNAIAWSASIKLATVEIERPKQSLLRTRKTEGSAAVALFLEPGVGRLTSGGARVVRAMVRGAYGLAPEVVTLTDNMGNLYEVDEDAGRDDDDERYLSNLRNDIRELVSGLFVPDEFNLVVRGYRSRPDKGPEPTTPSGPSRFGGLMVPGGLETIELPSRRDAPAASTESSEREAGPERGVNVVASFDLEAVRRVLGAEGGPFRNIEDFEARQKQAIENLVFPRSSHVSVLVQPLAKRVSLAGGDVGGGPASASGVPGSSTTGGVWHDWFARNWSLLAIVGGALAVAVIVGAAVAKTRAFSRRGGAARPGPARKVASAAAAPWRVFPGRAAAMDDPIGANGQDSLLSATDRMSEWVQERPQTAASVLRVWLAQPAGVGAAEVFPDGGPS